MLSTPRTAVVPHISVSAHRTVDVKGEGSKAEYLLEHGDGRTCWRRWSHCVGFANRCSRNGLRLPALPSTVTIGPISLTAISPQDLVTGIMNKTLDTEYLEQRQKLLQDYFRCCMTEAPEAVSEFMDDKDAPTVTTGADGEEEEAAKSPDTVRIEGVIHIDDNVALKDLRTPTTAMALNDEGMATPPCKKHVRVASTHSRSCGKVVLCM